MGPGSGGMACRAPPRDEQCRWRPARQGHPLSASRKLGKNVTKSIILVALFVRHQHFLPFSPVVTKYSIGAFCLSASRILLEVPPQRSSPSPAVLHWTALRPRRRAEIVGIRVFGQLSSEEFHQAFARSFSPKVTSSGRLLACSASSRSSRTG